MNKIERNKKIRNALILTGGVLAVGVGTYFGVKHSGKNLNAIAKNVESLAQSMRTLEIATYNNNIHRQNQMTLIDAAIEKGIPYQHIAGLGLRFDSMKDLAKAEKAVSRPLKEFVYSA